MSGRATGKNVAEHVINVFKDHEININNCRGQAYDGARAMSSDINGAKSYIKELNKKLHTLIVELNLTIANICQNASIKCFMYL